MTNLVSIWKGLLVGFLLIASIGLLAWRGQYEPKRTITWKLDDPELVGGFKPTLLGAPQVVKDKSGTSLFFDGVDDGLIIPTIPIKGWKKFTVEVLFKPDADGPIAPRFVHFEDTTGKRGTIEARITPAGMWYLDTFLKNGRTMKGLTLIDSANLHPCDQWYWISLVYDGEKMTHYINAKKELEGITEFGPLDTGQISLGVRLNKVNWFKGRIKEIRFHSDALKEEALGRVL
jgi:hypothetical protein